MKNKIILIVAFVSFGLFFTQTVFADNTINLKIKTNTSSIYDSQITVSPCDSDSNPDTPDNITPYCAIKQLEKLGKPILSDWTWYDFGALLNSINNIIGYTSKDKDGNDSVYHYWSWSLNGSEATEGLNKYDLKTDDLILLEFIDPVEIIPEVIAPPVQHSSGGSYIIKQPIIEKIIEKTFSVENALKFLINNQKSDGSYGVPMYTDWVAIGATTEEDSNLKSSLTNYFKTNSFGSSLLTDNERHAMALMALGIDPYNGTGVNYIKKITDSFDGTQFGDKTEDNDDIFALIVLKNAGYNKKDEMIVKDINYLLSKQASDGSYGSVDMTGASIQALRDFKDLKGVSEAISKGEGYLISKQGADFGFGNSFSTSWVLQAMSHNEQILKADIYLASKQEIDGGMEAVDTDMNTRIWATSYAIPAILHKPWNEILKVFPRQGLGEDKASEVKKINKEIIKKSVKTLEDRVKIENLIEDNNLSQNNKIQSKASRVWGMFKAPFSWLLDKLSF